MQIVAHKIAVRSSFAIVRMLFSRARCQYGGFILFSLNLIDTVVCAKPNTSDTILIAISKPV